MERIERHVEDVKSVAAGASLLRITGVATFELCRVSDEVVMVLLL
jgi:hypothetical protein